jgi:hypothetical protein
VCSCRREVACSVERNSQRGTECNEDALRDGHICVCGKSSDSGVGKLPVGKLLLRTATGNVIGSDTVVKRVSQSCKKRLFALSRLSVRLSAWKNLAPGGRGVNDGCQKTQV